MVSLSSGSHIELSRESLRDSLGLQISHLLLKLQYSLVAVGQGSLECLGRSSETVCCQAESVVIAVAANEFVAKTFRLRVGHVSSLDLGLSRKPARGARTRACSSGSRRGRRGRRGSREGPGSPSSKAHPQANQQDKGQEDHDGKEPAVVENEHGNVVVVVQTIGWCDLAGQHSICQNCAGTLAVSTKVLVVVAS